MTRLLTSILALVCAALSALVLVAWALHLPPEPTDAFLGGCIAVLYPFLDSCRRRHAASISLSWFLWDCLCMGLPIAAVGVIHHTLPMLVMAAVFVTGALVTEYSPLVLDRALVAASFLLLWGMAGRALLGRHWMHLIVPDKMLLAFMLPAAVLTTVFASRFHR